MWVISSFSISFDLSLEIKIMKSKGIWRQRLQSFSIKSQLPPPPFMSNATDTLFFWFLILKQFDNDPMLCCLIPSPLNLTALTSSPLMIYIHSFVTFPTLSDSQQYFLNPGRQICEVFTLFIPNRLEHCSSLITGRSVFISKTVFSVFICLSAHKKQTELKKKM